MLPLSSSGTGACVGPPCNGRVVCPAQCAWPGPWALAACKTVKASACLAVCSMVRKPCPPSPERLYLCCRPACRALKPRQPESKCTQLRQRRSPLTSPAPAVQIYVTGSFSGQLTVLAEVSFLSMAGNWTDASDVDSMNGTLGHLGAMYMQNGSATWLQQYAGSPEEVRCCLPLACVCVYW